MHDIGIWLIACSLALRKTFRFEVRTFSLPVSLSLSLPFVLVFRSCKNISYMRERAWLDTHRNVRAHADFCKEEEDKAEFEISIFALLAIQRKI
jgi:hypothetical protein